MWIEPLRALLTESVLACAAAVVARRSNVGAKVGALVLGSVAALGAPLLAGSHPLHRGLCALVGFIGMLRIIDVVRIGGSWSAGRRVIHVMSFVDSRTLERAPSKVDVRALGRAFLWAALATGAFYVARSPLLVARWAGGLVLAYALIEAGYATVFAAYRLAGFITPPLHVWPMLSLSVGELWGTRWARPVSTWLRETCFRPLARRGHALLGLLLGFFVSALGHAYPTLLAVGGSMAAMMFAFFIAQGLFVLLEIRLGAARWSRPARRLWTITVMVATSPLFVEPALRVLL